MFLFRLALNLGMTVAELGERMGAAEFAEWLAYNRLEPLPDPWLQTGVIAAATVNVWRGKGRAAEPTDFVPRPKQARRGKRLTPATQTAFLATYCATQAAQPKG